MLTAQDTMPQRDSAGVLLKLKKGFTIETYDSKEGAMSRGGIDECSLAMGGWVAGRSG